MLRAAPCKEQMCGAQHSFSSAQPLHCQVTSKEASRQSTQQGKGQVVEELFLVAAPGRKQPPSRPFFSSTAQAGY